MIIYSTALLTFPLPPKYYPSSLNCCYSEASHDFFSTRNSLGSCEQLADGAASLTHCPSLKCRRHQQQQEGVSSPARAETQGMSQRFLWQQLPLVIQSFQQGRQEQYDPAFTTTQPCRPFSGRELQLLMTSHTTSLSTSAPVTFFKVKRIQRHLLSLLRAQYPHPGAHSLLTPPPKNSKASSPGFSSTYTSFTFTPLFLISKCFQHLSPLRTHLRKLTDLVQAGFKTANKYKNPPSHLMTAQVS